MADVQRFRLAPITTTSFAVFMGTFPLGWIALVAGFVPLGLGGAGLLFPSLRMPWGTEAVLIVAGLLVPTFVALAVFWSRTGFVEISDNWLAVRGAPNGPAARLQSLRLQEARTVDLRADRSFWPSGGVAVNVPGCYSAGSGTVRRGVRVAWFITDPSRLVYVPATAGQAVLVSAESPESLVMALRSMPESPDARS